MPRYSSLRVWNVAVQNLWHRLRGHPPPDKTVQVHVEEPKPETGADILRRLLDEPVEEPKPGPNANILRKLLEQPTDIVLIVLDAMPMQDRLMLAQTCRAWRSIILQSPACLFGRQHVEGEPLNKLMTSRERIDYLFIPTRDRVDAWVCSYCEAVHPVRLARFDEGLEWWHTACDKARRQHCGIVFTSGVMNRATMKVRHEKVQTALRSIRQWNSIGPEHRQYVMDILHSASYFTRGVHRSLQPAKWVMHTARMHPKVVVNEPDLSSLPTGLSRRLRFVTKTMHFFHYPDYDGGEMDPSTVPYLRACAHCLYEPLACLLRLDDAGAMSDYQPMCAMVRDAYSSPRVSEGTHIPIPLFGSCSMCATDFTVSFSQDKHTFILRVWQDLGGEGSVTDPAWTAMHFKLHKDIKTTYESPYARRHHHEPGSVMRMYEEGQALVYTEPPHLGFMGGTLVEERTDLSCLARARPFYVSEPLDDKLLSREKQNEYSMTQGWDEERWSSMQRPPGDMDWEGLQEWVSTLDNV